MPNYSDAQIAERVKDKKDAGRAATNAKLFAQATQPPHGDDAAALTKLRQLAGDDSTGGWATNDARNDARRLLNTLGGPQMEYSEARDGRFSIGKGLGTLLRVGAPIAGMAIPGLGTLGAMALSGLGNSAGQLMSKGNINPLESLAAGAAPGAGRLLGGAMKGGGALGANVGNATQAMPGVAGAAGGGGGGVGGFLSGAVSKLGGLGGAAKIGLGAAKFLGDRAQRKNAEQFAQSQLELKNRMLGMAEQDYGARAPLRDAAFSRLGAMARGPMGSSVYR